MDDVENAPSGNTVSMNLLNEVAGNSLVTSALKSEMNELGINDINLKSLKHKPSADSNKVKLDRVIGALIPQLEELESDVFFINNVDKFADLNQK